MQVGKTGWAYILDRETGELIFVGRSNGRLTALSTTTGEILWEFMTDAGVNSTVTTFAHDGEQYVVVQAGGGVFANGARGDGGEGGGANLLTGLTVETTVSETATGRNNMPAFCEAYTIDELYDVALFVVENLAQDN